MSYSKQNSSPSDYRVTADDLAYHTNPDFLPKDSRIALKNFELNFGQDRAVHALCTALDIQQAGYHVFATGKIGLGKKALIMDILSKRAKNQPTPDDWVYVHNFNDPLCPMALNFEAGMGHIFAQKIHTLFKQIQKKLQKKFLSLTYQRKIDQLRSQFLNTQTSFYKKLDKNAKKHHLNLVINENGQADFISADADNANTSSDEAAKASLLAQFYDIEHKLDLLEQKIQKQLDDLRQDTASAIIRPLFDPLLEKFSDQKVHLYLTCLQNDLINNALAISEHIADFPNHCQNSIYNRYYVNVITQHKKQAGAPVIFADMPTYAKLFGITQYATDQGTTYCDASMIQAGLLHQANGGYLILKAQALFEYPYIWQGLKQALQTQKITITNPDELSTQALNQTLKPDEITLNIKVILLGQMDLYYDLLAGDPQLESLFKIRADFNEQIEKNAQSEIFLVQKMIYTIQKNQLTPFDKTAFAEILDELCRLSENKKFFYFHQDTLDKLLFESAYIANQHNDPWVQKTHVKTAISQHQKRHDYISSLYWQEIKNGHQLFSVTGSMIGQINALTIVDFGSSDSQTDAFGLPCKITALIQPNFGSGEILDIERDTELAGGLHAKGTLIMASFLRSLFGEFGEFNFSASLAMEQNYTYVDGDSATLAQMCVLFSALADVPIYQNLAITGSMNQLGFAQAIGGVSQKVTGFFNACKIHGLTGDQGVIIPKSNIQDLLLSDEILDAIRCQKFHIYAVCHVFEALALLTQSQVCDKNKRGDYKKDSLFGKIVSRFHLWEKSLNKKL